MLKWRIFLWVLIGISLSFLCGCGELHRLRETNIMQEAKIWEMEKQDKQSKSVIYDLKVEKEKDQIKYRGEIENLQKEVSDLKEKRSEREQLLSDENFILTRKVQSYENQLNTLQTEGSKQKEELAQLKSQYESTVDTNKRDLGNLEEEKKSLILENTELKSKNQEQEKNLLESNTLQKKLEKQLSDRDSLVTELTAQLNVLKEQVKTMQSSAVYDKKHSETDASARIKSLLEEVETKFQKALSEEMNTDKIKIKRNDRALIIHLYSDDLFEKGTVIIGDNAKPLLLKISSLINQNPGFDVDVEGHTDNIPIENLPFLDNLALSSARADNVLRFLIDEGLINKKIAKSVACSWFHPVSLNDTPVGRKENRRVEIVLKPQ